MKGIKRVLVIVRGDDTAAEGLRGAVGLAAGGLSVRVLLCERGVRLLGRAGQAAKALGTLRVLHHDIVAERESLRACEIPAPDWVRLVARDEIAKLLEEADAVESWR